MKAYEENSGRRTPEMNGQYDDIMNLPYHKSLKYPHMTREDRAAQFSPFAALKGFDEEIDRAAQYEEEDE